MGCYVTRMKRFLWDDVTYANRVLASQHQRWAGRRPTGCCSKRAGKVTFDRNLTMATLYSVPEEYVTLLHGICLFVSARITKDSIGSMLLNTVYSGYCCNGLLPLDLVRSNQLCCNAMRQYYNCFLLYKKLGLSTSGKPAMPVSVTKVCVSHTLGMQTFRQARMSLLVL